MNRADELPPLHLLILARLLAGGATGVPPTTLSKNLKPMIEHRWNGPEWASQLDRAIVELKLTRAVGHPIDKKGKPTKSLSTTEEGRRLALEAFGLEALPPKTTWAKIRVYLVAHALGRPGPTEADVNYLGGAAGLKGELLRSHFGLTIPADRPKPKDLADATAAKLMGLEPSEKFTTDNILRKLLRDVGIEIPAGKKPSPTSIGDALFCRELGDPKAKKPFDLIATRIVGARKNNAKELTDAFLRSWIDGREPKPSDVEEALIVPSSEQAAPIDLPAFAQRVLEAARSSPTGRFGNAKVFISHVWRALGDDPAIRDLGVEGFKKQLIEAHRARLLELSRADLVEAMEPADVRESATPYQNVVYHFVRTEDPAR